VFFWLIANYKRNWPQRKKDGLLVFHHKLQNNKKRPNFLHELQRLKHIKEEGKKEF
jgi:hypothetical protein